MSFNASNCITISITRKKNKINHDYSLHNQILEHLPSTTYLGVELKSDLTWKNHIDKTCAKANRQLGFLRRNLQIQNSKLKETAYKGLVWPVTDYCATVWDPHFKKYINQLEMVQRRADQFIFNAYQPIAPVTEMINNLGWEKLETRRLKARLTIMYKIKHELAAIPLPAIVTAPIQSTPRHPHDYNNIYASTDAYKNSFFIRTVKQWNCLPQSIYSKESLLSFKAALDSYSLC